MEVLQRQQGFCELQQTTAAAEKTVKATVGRASVRYAMSFIEPIYRSPPIRVTESPKNTFE